MREPSSELPPDELIDRVTTGVSEENAESIREEFRSTGRLSIDDLSRALASVGRTLESYPRILDFGCGCGRMMAWLEPLAERCELHGTDIDERAIAWCQEHLPHAQFTPTGQVPPTSYPDDFFDLVFNHSVLTHLDEVHQDLWLDELRRIVKPGGTIVLTAHGEKPFQDSERAARLGGEPADEWRRTLQRDGILFVDQDSYVGSVFPSFYHTTFHAPWYVFEHWGRRFNVRAHLTSAALGFQDMVVLERPVDEAALVRPVAPRPSEAVEVAAPAEDALARARAELERGVAPRYPSNFGAPGELVRRVVLRAMRPYTVLERSLDRDLAEAIAGVRRLVEEVRALVSSEVRVSPVVRDVLNRQSERMKRLERELRAEQQQLADRLGRLERGAGSRTLRPG
jgi:SAM-dependent methyltransferase